MTMVQLAQPCIVRMEFANDPRGHFFQTTPEDGLLYKQAKQIARLFRGDKVKYDGEVK